MSENETAADPSAENNEPTDPTPETPDQTGVPDQPGADEPAAEQPSMEVEEAPAAEAPAAEPPAAEAPAEETSAEESPAVEAPAAETTVAETPAAESPAAETPAGPTAIVAPDLSELPDDLGASDFEAAIDATVLEFREGDIVEGTVVNVDADGAMLDIGYKSEGLIPVEELSIRNTVDPKDVVAVGERVEAVVLNKEDDEGRLILSKKRAQYERAWGRIQQVANRDETVTGTVIEVVKGGLIVDIGLRGFLPASLVDLRRVRDLDPFIGTEIEAKVIELDRNRNNVVLSRRAYLEEEQAEQRQAFLATTSPRARSVRERCRRWSTSERSSISAVWTDSSMCPSCRGSTSIIRRKSSRSATRSRSRSWRWIETASASRCRSVRPSRIRGSCSLVTTR